ncbi:serine/threonine-protein phosphatase [Nocardioides sp. TRM66260-LWL]|uniref:PP2C family protein-serine/threonine phosphatase n=1 Tax=Nocardioides sp. TRM66260-LWL TaxID=2874478 RepID=UPI001CC70679|nr:PP2C family protein-serine/threonine phosphatase [Nocardioides sp. TRM66260-LWL]MBZ5736126.1 serine/threonine-protein phosphatase [Nocardioides sp. TRM66260-LWL]
MALPGWLLRARALTGASGEPRSGRGSLLSVGILVVGVVVTGLLAWSCHRADEGTERRLLRVRADQAAVVLQAAVGTIVEPLESTVAAEATVPAGRRRPAFPVLLAPEVGDGRLFVHASLWEVRSSGVRMVASLGEDRLLVRRRLETRLRVAAASAAPAPRTVPARAPNVTVQRITGAGQDRIGYALGRDLSGGGQLVVYAERRIPADRRAAVDRDPAFVGLDYAIYLGTPSADALTTTDQQPASLPLDGVTATVPVPFGDQTLTLVVRARERLGGRLSGDLPWLVLLAGAAITAGALLTGRRLTRARLSAERDAGTIDGLYRDLDAAFAVQSDSFGRLQRALLPRTTPQVCGLEVASHYRAAATETEVGGDWFSALGVAERSIAVVIGDVSGHGIDAVAEMARARFTLRALLAEGHGPGEALARTAAQFADGEDWRIITAAVGVLDADSGEATICSAGHPPPLLVHADGRASLLDLVPAAPLGLVATRYPEHRFRLEPDESLVLYTDGLVERRAESPEVGQARLLEVVSRLAGRPVDDFAEALVSAMTGDAAGDDVAVLVVRRAGAPAPPG